MDNLNIYQLRLLDICEDLIDWFGWDLQKEQKDWDENKRRSIKPSENIKKAVFKAKENVIKDYQIGIQRLYENCFSNNDSYAASICDYIDFSSKDDFTEENIKKQNTLIKIVSDIMSLQSDWHTMEFRPLLNEIFKHNDLFENPIQTDPKIISGISTLVEEGKFKIYSYKQGAAQIMPNDKFCIGSQIGFSEDLTAWFKHIQKQEDFLSAQKDDTVFVTLFGQLNKIHPIFSNWVLCFQKGDSIWIATDQVNYDNPNQLVSRLGRKSAWRDADELYDSCDLPYDIFHDLDSLRKEQTSIISTSNLKKIPLDLDGIKEVENASFSKRHSLKIIALKKELAGFNVEYNSYLDSGSNGWGNLKYATFKNNGIVVAHWENNMLTIFNETPEFLFKKTVSLEDGQKLFLVFLVNKLIDHFDLLRNDIKRIMLSSEFIEQKLLGDEKFNPIKTSNMQYWTDDNKERFQEIIDSVHTVEQTTALVNQSYGLVKQSYGYNPSALMTPQKQESLAQWLILHGEKRNIDERLSSIFEENKKQSYEQLQKMFAEKYDEIASRIMNYEEIVFIGNYNYGTWKSQKTTSDQCQNGRIYVSEERGIDSKRGTGIGKTGWDVERCTCNNFTTKKQRTVYIHHYNELVWLLGLNNRKELPLYYRNYKRHNLIPYTGNSILNQTHPYLDVKDPLSEAKPNGLYFSFFMCGHCARKFKGGKKLVVTMEGGEWVERPVEKIKFSQNHPHII